MLSGINRFVKFFFFFSFSSAAPFASAPKDVRFPSSCYESESNELKVRLYHHTYENARCVTARALLAARYCDAKIA